jgi:beta-glucanase (GH16 family)
MPEVLVWSDDFLGTAGQAPSAAKWVHETGKGSVIGGNGELEVYRNNRKNSYLDGDSHLVIAATLENGVYYSARLQTFGLFSAYQGTWQASIRYTTTKGCWPAWWMMGNNPPGWPTSGEVDAFEVYGVPGWAPQSTVWLPEGDVMANNIAAPFAVDANWHTYQMVWDNEGMHFSQDGVEYLSVPPQPAAEWPYVPGNELYMLLNMAVGGTGGGDPSNTTFPVTMEVDWVRVYQWQA